MFKSVLYSVTGTLSVENALVCAIVAVVLGLVIAGVYMLQGDYTKNYVITLAVLPVMVQAVIMLVNGNLGTGIAIMGAFSLVRFRSVPGSSREIVGVFYAMVIGLATGMGYLTYAGLITVIVGFAMILLHKLHFGEKKNPKQYLKITIPENLDFTELFEDILQEYTRENELVRVKTVNMGSMYELYYRIGMKNNSKVKKMIDEIRVRNGNLPVVCGRILIETEEL